MLGASCALEVSETVLTEWRNPEESEEGMTSGSSKDVSNSSVSMGISEDRIQALFIVGNHLGLERNNPHTMIPVESG